MQGGLILAKIVFQAKIFLFAKIDILFAQNAFKSL